MPTRDRRRPTSLPVGADPEPIARARHGRGLDDRPTVGWDEYDSPGCWDEMLAPGRGRAACGGTIEEVFERGAGVCQDSAHVAIGCLRSVWLAARYVSGYLETRPPPGQPRLAGSDVSHAWLSVFVPGAGWVDIDPTNDQLVNDRYVTTAWGRDYTDVSPLKGVIFIEGSSHDLQVMVDVIPVDEADWSAPPE